MRIRSVQLKTFRNYQDIDLDFSLHLNIIVGPNAQGKTNLVESIFFLSRGYSHRTTVKTELATFGETGFVIRGIVDCAGRSESLGVQYIGTKKTLMRNGKKQKKQEELSAVCKVILFEPEDLRIVKAGPEKRRRFLDEEISGILPGYDYVWKQYHKVLKQRNVLLKEIRFDNTLRMMLEPWDIQLAQYGAKLMAYRIEYLKKLKIQAAALHRKMSDDHEDLALYYQNNILKALQGIRNIQDIEAVFRQKLAEEQDRDIEKGTTCCGPHLDDLLIVVNGRDARKYASQGQQRTAAIALKLSRIAICEESTGEAPIVLLDDVLSELDARRQEGILKLLDGTQAFITCTDDSFVEKYREVLGEDEIRTISVERGKIIN